MTGRASMKNDLIRTRGNHPAVWLVLWTAMAAVGAKSASVGPDSFGYVATDVTPYSFVDISSTGVSVLAGADDDKALVNLGFPFAFYGLDYTGVCVSSNGLLTFGGCNSDFANQDLTGTTPTGDYPTIAPFWSDLSFAVSGAGAVYYQALGQPGDRQFVVQWQNAYPLNGSKGVTFQAILYEAGGRIVFQYLDVNTGAGSQTSNGGSATVGIRDSGGQTTGRALQWSYKAPVLQNGQAILFARNPGPIITPSVQGTPGNNGWYLSDVDVSWNVSDPVSGISSSTGCSTTTLTAETAAVTLTCSATNGAGVSTSVTITVKIDKTQPIVTFSGNAGIYTVDQTVAITCSGSDSLSGLASATCDMAGPAWSFPLGVNTYPWTAADNAGNTVSGEASFTVQVTFASLCTLTRQFCTKAGVADNLCADLNAAAAAAARGNAKAKAGAIKSYINDVKAQIGKSLKADQANTLMNLARAL